MRMKLAGAALLALGTLAATAGTAEAAQGCGPGFHRGWSGWCKPNWRPYAYRPVYYARPVVYGWHRPWGWHHRWGWRHAGWHRPWGWHHHGGWRRAAWHYRW
ncbi:GCG_CRPN prefix-to-repeats domain-containing protein [Methylobacterium mesophilicum]|uniref:GCG_CRPN prefix-to-repeats domain-containing protein n=1 Tax=Methylobacterium mesophilicum TaxID=39956 RepID=UPI003AF56E50